MMWFFNGIRLRRCEQRTRELIELGDRARFYMQAENSGTKAARLFRCHRHWYKP